MIRMNYSNPPAVSLKGFSHRTFRSAIYACEIGYNIYLPADYDQSSERYPVVYHFHGWMGNESSEIGFMEEICRSRKAITVFVNHSHVDGEVQKLPAAPMFIGELIPHIDSVYRTIASREGRMISGFSMGGGIAASLAFRYPDLFSEVTAYAGTYHHYYHRDYSTVGTPVSQAADIYRQMIDEKKFFEGSIISCLFTNADEIRGRVKITLHVGEEDILHCDNEILHLHLETLRIPHEYRKFAGADHNLRRILLYNKDSE